MGSHFTNNDLTKGHRLAEQFVGEIVKRPAEGGLYVIELTPKPDAPIVWGKVIVEITPEKLPQRVTYFNEGELVRTMTFSDVRTFGERTIPSRIRMQLADRPDEFTDIVYEMIEFVTIPDSMFSFQSLKY